MSTAHDTMNDSPPTPEAPAVHALTVLADPSCQAVLAYFHKRSSGAATVDELASYWAERSDRKRDYDQCSIRLHHVTLPKLDDHGIVAYDAGRGTVRYRGGEDAEELVRLIV